MALKTISISGNGSKGHHIFTLIVNEESTSGNNSIVSYSFQLAPLQRGWDWASWGTRISYSVSIGGNSYSGSIPAYDGSSTVTLSSKNGITIPHNADGTKTIDISFNVTDTTGQNYTCGNASSTGSLKLTDLHKPPVASITAFTELNTAITPSPFSITTQVVSNLSKKRFTVSYSFYDSATISNIKIYDKLGNELTTTDKSLGASSGTIAVDFRNVPLNPTAYTGNTTNFIVEVIDNKGGATRITSSNYTVIPYTQPTLNLTATTIARKTGSGTVLTDNKANLNLQGTFYKGSNVIGNNNTITAKYKIWATDSSEPSSYTTITSPTISGGNITVSNRELTNVLYTKAYYYKIIITDRFNIPSSEKNSKVSTGLAVWSEYRDHVNFIGLTINNTNVHSPCVMSLSYSRHTQTFTQWEETKITNATLKTDSFGEGLTFDQTNNAIKIGKGVSKVLVSAVLNWGGGSQTQTDHALKIYKERNGYYSENYQSYLVAGTIWISNTVVQGIFSVQENDLIWLSGMTGLTLSREILDSSYLTVQVLS